MKKKSTHELSIVIPVLNEEENLPTLFRALEKQINTDFEVLFVDNNSTDSSSAMIQSWQKKQKNKSVALLQEKKCGFPAPLQAGIRRAKGKKILCLDADCIPLPSWTKEMQTALQQHPLVVGETENFLSPQATASEKLAKILFHQYSYRCVNAIGHALPWGPTCNLGIQKNLFSLVGSFQDAAGSAFDMDWCWRAVLKGILPHYCASAKVQHKRKKTEEAFLAQMARYGTGEAWIRKNYSFLLSKEEQQLHVEQDPLQACLAGADRILSALPQTKLSQKVATAFACGIMAGFQKTKKTSSHKKIPTWGFPIGAGEKEIRILVPGKGILHLDEDGKTLWKLFLKNKNKTALAKAMQQEFKISKQEALHEVEHFIEAIQVNT